LTETSVFVALVLTAALEFFNAVFKNSMRGRRETPPMPNSIMAVSIHPSASARTLGAFCFPSGSYAILEGHHKAGLKGGMNVPWLRTNCRDVFSAKAVSDSPAGFLSFMSPSFSDR
jgi:hypothetical protein